MQSIFRYCVVLFLFFASASGLSAELEGTTVVVEQGGSTLDWIDGIRALVVLLIGITIVIACSRLARKWVTKRHTVQGGFIAGKIINYVGVIFVLMTVLLQLGFNLTAVLGAAGVATVAISFAAQTSLSNLISGLFILWEQPFKVGDMILVNNTRGAVLSIDLLSVKLRTLDNLFIRVPNTSIIQSQVTTITRFPIRRMDLNLGVAYKEDVEHVMAVLKDVADKNPYCLDEPSPVVIFNNFGDSALEFFMGMWFERSNFLNLKNSIMADIKKRFDEEGIEIPFPHRSLYTGSVTDPFPIRIVNGETLEKEAEISLPVKGDNDSKAGGEKATGS